MYEPRGPEGKRGLASRLKVGLEIPLSVRFVSEGRKVLFAPPAWYDTLVVLCLAAGALLALSSAPVFDLPVFDPTWRLWTGAAVVLAGTWAALSNERMTCDSKTRTFIRLEGQGPLKSVSKGDFADFDALVLLCESTFGPSGPVVTYRLVLHWKNSRMPLLVVTSATFPHAQGAPLNYASAPILALGQRVAQIIGVPLYDNSYFQSPEPLRVI